MTFRFRRIGLLLASVAALTLVVFSSNVYMRTTSVNLGVLTEHERQLFRKFQETQQVATDKFVHALKPEQGHSEVYKDRPSLKKGHAREDIKNRLRVKKGQILGSCGGSISCFDLATIRENQANLPDIPSCYSPESCRDYSQQAGYFGDTDPKNSSELLPIYDHDGPELVAAMQKQDNIILDVKQARELRAKQGENAPPLKPIICGSDCFERIGAWCCRKTW